MDSINFDTFDSPAGGVELSDTLSSWRKKTNGIITKISAEAAELDTLQGKVNGFQDGNNTIALNKIVKVGGSKLLGNLASGSENVVEIEIDVTASGLQDSDSTIPTSKAVKDHVALGERYISGRINANGTASALHGISVSRVEAGVYNVIVADSHQLPSGESYSVIAQLGVNLDPFVDGLNAINDSFSIHVFKIDDIGGDPAYRVEIFELESTNVSGGGNDNNSVANVDLDRRDAPFSVIGLPASDQ